MSKASPAVMRKAAKVWKIKNRARMSDYNKAWNKRRVEKVSALGLCVYCQKRKTATGRKVCQACVESTGDGARRRKYGLTRADLESLIESQDGRCAICLVSIAIGDGAHVDHDHKSNKVRAVLCGNCNRGLGCFRDSPEALEAAAQYLRKHT